MPEGGTLRIVAQTLDDRLAVAVIDTGRGLTGSSGGGTGLANIRARLSASYGEKANLSIQGNQPRGIIATLTLPQSLPWSPPPTSPPQSPLI